MFKTNLNPKQDHTHTFVTFDEHVSEQTRVENFHIRRLGYLEKRSGVRVVFDLGAPIRALWSGLSQSAPISYFLSGATVYAASIAKRTATPIGKVDNSEGNANFFALQGTLYLTDGGTKVYRIEKNAVVPVLGYVPLFGKDWDPQQVGEIYEPRNLLNRHARITYIAPAMSTFLSLPPSVASVDAVYRNGTLIPPEQYHFNKDYSVIEFSAFQKGDRAEVLLTFPESEEANALRPLFCSMKNSVFFCNEDKNRTFFFDGNGSNIVFCARYVSEELLDEARRYYDTDPLYLPEGYEFRVGDGTYPVRAAMPHYNSLLIFTEKDTWIADAASAGLSLYPTYPVNAELGCVTSNGCVLALNDPITVSRQGIYRWERQEPDDPRRTAVRISDELNRYLTAADLRESSLFYDDANEELWLNIRTKNEMWLCCPSVGVWYCFTGIVADRIFDIDGTVAFTNGSQISVLDKSLLSDVDILGQLKSIPVCYESAPFGFFEKPKNLVSFCTLADFGNSEITLDLIEDNGKVTSALLKAPFRDGTRFRTHRLRSGRFRTARFRLSGNKSGHVVIRAITFKTT